MLISSVNRAWYGRDSYTIYESAGSDLRLLPDTCVKCIIEFYELDATLRANVLAMEKPNFDELPEDKKVDHIEGIFDNLNGTYIMRGQGTTRSAPWRASPPFSVGCGEFASLRDRPHRHRSRLAPCRGVRDPRGNGRLIRQVGLEHDGQGVG